MSSSNAFTPFESDLKGVHKTASFSTKRTMANQNLHTLWRADGIDAMDNQRNDESQNGTNAASKHSGSDGKNKKRTKAVRRNSIVIKDPSQLDLISATCETIDQTIEQPSKRMRCVSGQSLSNEENEDHKDDLISKTTHYLGEALAINWNVLCLPTSETIWAQTLALPRSSSFTSSVIEEPIRDETARKAAFPQSYEKRAS